MRESLPSAPVCNACCFAKDPCSPEPTSKDPACFCWKDLQLLLSYAGQKRGGGGGREKESKGSYD